MFRWLGGLMDRICAVAGAIVCAQAPLFMKQYTQQLVGREAELRMQVDAMRNAAAISGKTLEQLINKFLTNPDADFAHQGEVMQNLVTRWHGLFDALNAMESSPFWERPFTFAYHLNTDIFKSTLSNFTFGIPMTVEGGIYAVAGIALGYGLFALVRSACRRLYCGLKAVWSAN